MKPKLSKLLLCASLLTACSQAAEYQLEELATELKRPWGLAFIDAGQIVITEKAGSAQLFDLASGQRRPLSGLPKDIYSRGQGG
ncbi:MAG: PQQ-dependent sugar dehydrogenase, partial [Cellvibrionaceae bacterium]|nr:PQQ-dependent sugar dehydrogenase [Cellvibrionaceae bacterium]